MPEAVLRANANVLNYVKSEQCGCPAAAAALAASTHRQLRMSPGGALSLLHARSPNPALPAPTLTPAEHHLWGATPFANVVHLSWEAQQAWNASAALMQAAGGDPGATATSADENTTAAGVECCLHKTVCAAYYLPDKYQGTPTRSEVRTCVYLCICLLPEGAVLCWVRDFAAKATRLLLLLLLNLNR